MTFGIRIAAVTQRLSFTQFAHTTYTVSIMVICMSLSVTTKKITEGYCIWRSLKIHTERNYFWSLITDFFTYKSFSIAHY